MQPGETITPGGSAPTEPKKQPAEQLSKPAADSAPVVSSSEAPKPLPSPPDNHNVSWTASEYIAHQKGSSWYMLLVVAVVVLSVAVYLLTNDVVSTVATSVGVALLGIFATRQPQVLTYGLSHQGIQVGHKFYPYHDFKSFSVQESGGINSVLFTSMKRFMPGLSIYYPPEQEEEIISFLADYLPHEELAVDPLDKFMRKLRF